MARIEARLPAFVELKDTIPTRISPAVGSEHERWAVESRNKRSRELLEKLIDKYFTGRDDDQDKTFNLVRLNKTLPEVGYIHAFSVISPGVRTTEIYFAKFGQRFVFNQNGVTVETVGNEDNPQNPNGNGPISDLASAVQLNQNINLLKNALAKS